MSARFQLWKRSLDVAAGAPEVIARRTSAMQRTPWSADTLAESNRMVWEKAAAANEAWWSLCRDSFKRVRANKARLRHKAGRHV